MEEKNDIAEIDVKEIFYLLIRKAWLIILFLLVGAAVSWAVSRYLIQPIYTSTAKVYIINKQNGTSLTLTDLQSGEQLTKDYMILVKSRPVMEQVVKDLNLSLTTDEFTNRITVNTPENTRVLEISANSTSPDIAKKMVDSIAEVSAERMVSVMGIEKVNIMEYGNLPTKPSSPNVIRNTMLGGIAGAMLISVVIILVFLANDSIRSTDDIENYLGITALGILPMDEGTKKVTHRNLISISLFRRKRRSSVA